MEATEILMSEHRVIERIIAALEQAASALQHNQPVRMGFFLDAADFIKGFADGCHHRKEEGVLFKAMVRQGFSEQQGPVAVMLVEHEQGRVFTRAMRAAAEAAAAGELAPRQQVISNALGYCSLLRQHIQKEDQILFPMADRVIPPAEQAKLAEDFETVEHEETGAGVHEKYLALAEKLEKEATALV